MKSICTLASLVIAVIILGGVLYAQDSCPYPVFKNVTCEEGTCKQSKIFIECSGPKSDRKCKYGLLTYTCCNESYHQAMQEGDCDKPGGPDPLIIDLREQAFAVRARVYVSNCRGSFEPMQGIEPRL